MPVKQVGASDERTFYTVATMFLYGTGYDLTGLVGKNKKKQQLSIAIFSVVCGVCVKARV